MTGVKNVLYPTDFSDPADRAFDVAQSLARQQGARLIVLHVSPPVAVPLREVLTEHRPAQAYYDELREKLLAVRPEDPGVAVEHILAEGDAAGEILRVAQAKRADLIVMGTHGRTGLERLLLGSVAEQVLRSASCPVLTLKSPAPRAVPAGQPFIVLEETGVRP
jgi:nucleotide-binding universal stress UspA family protein